MRQLLNLCLLLPLLSVQADDPFTPAQLAQAKYCQFMAGRKYKQLCIGRYTLSLKIRYLDNKVVPNTQYAVYRAEDSDSEYLATLRISELHACKLLENVNYTRFDCKDEKNEKPINLLLAGMYCFDYQVEYVDDLLELCRAQRKMPHNDAKSTKVSILYTYRSTLRDFNSAAGGLLSHRLVLALLCLLPLRL